MNPRAVWLFYYLVSVVACSVRVIWVKWVVAVGYCCVSVWSAALVIPCACNSAPFLMRDVLF